MNVSHAQQPETGFQPLVMVQPRGVAEQQFQLDPPGNALYQSFTPDRGMFLRSMSIVVSQRFGQVNRKGNLSVLPRGGQLGKMPGIMVVGSVGGFVMARAYFRSMLREMPNCRAISRSEMPWVWASCAAFHSASWRGDSGRFSGAWVSLSAFPTWPSSSAEGSGSRLARHRN